MPAGCPRLRHVGSASDPDHEAAIRFGGKAPRRRAHSNDGSTTMFRLGSPPPRIVIGRPARRCRHGAETCVRSLSLLSSCARSSRNRPQHDASRDSRRQSPCARARSTACGRARRSFWSCARRSAPSVRARIPMCQRAIFLEQQKPPSELDQPAPHASVAGFGQSFLSPLRAALVRRAVSPA